MKVSILPSILKGGGGRDKGGTEKEGGRTGRGDIQGGGTYREGGIQGGGTYMEGGQGGHTGSGGWSLSVGARCPQAPVICGRGHRLSAGARYSWAGSLSSEGDHRCPRWGVIVVHGGGSSLSVGTAMPVLCRRVVGVVWGVFGTCCSWWGHRCLRRVVVGAWGSLWSMVSVGGRRPWVGGHRCACVGSLSVHACVGGRPHLWAPDRCSGVVVVGGGRSLLWCVCVAVNVACPDGLSTCHVSSSVVAPFVGHHRHQRSSRSSFL
jgi:hypothetical protein